MAPEAYKLQFENSQVRVLRVHYAAKAKIPVHDHSKWPAAYVYLNDAGEIIFSHTGWNEPILTRRPHKRRWTALQPGSAAAAKPNPRNPPPPASPEANPQGLGREAKVRPFRMARHPGVRAIAHLCGFP